MDIAAQISEKILALQSALLAQHPNIHVLLNDIDKNLRANPDVVTLLTEEEVGVIVNGLKQQTKVEIATTALKSGSKKSLKNLSVDDL